jgi:glycosyltransferase involved in cell wall biosynthesis
MREYVDHLKTGLLINPGDAKAMRNAITMLLSDSALATEMARLARLKYEQDFTFLAFARRTNKILQDFHSSCL